MSTRTITGNLAADIETVQAGSITITKFRVIENTGEYRAGNSGRYRDWDVTIEDVFIGADESDCEVRATR